MTNTVRTLLLSSLLFSTACLASGSAGFGLGGGARAGGGGGGGNGGPPPSTGVVEDPGSSYAGPAGPMGGTDSPQGPAVAAEPRWDDFSFAVRERGGTYHGAWVISKLTTFKVGQACFAKMADKDSGALNNAGYYIRNVEELAKKWTNEEWERVENQKSDRKKDRFLVEPMIDAFGQQFHMTIAVEGDDCEVDRDALWVGYWYQISEAFADYPPAAGKLFINLNVSAAARDVKVDIDETGTVFTITAPRDIEAKDWHEKLEKPFRKMARNI